MNIESLKLLNFRNYNNLYVEFNKNINLIIGENGKGKTNIVEAIYMLSIGKSFRTSKDKEMIKFNKDSFYILGKINNLATITNIEIFVDKNKKGIKINKIPITRINELLGTVNVVVFSPEDLKLVKDGPKERRLFIDKEMSQIRPKYYNYLMNYNKILQQRNKLLKNYNIDKNLLDIYDINLAKYGSYIYILRRDFIKKLSNISKSFHMDLTNNKEVLSINYKNQINLTQEDDIETVKKKLLKKISDNRQNDIEIKNTKYGIHKDDFYVNINNLDVKLYGSQGQQRTASISLKLSEIELIKKEIGEYPILLLDDVFSELDEIRQKLLVKKLDNIQMFITTAEKSHKNVFGKKNITTFNIDDGKVVSIENGGN